MSIMTIFNTILAMAAAATAPSTPSTRCKLLEIPQEMRDAIYEYTFTPDTDEDDEVDLLHDAAPPSNAICCTNKQINAESKKLYTKAFRAYYRESKFALNLDTPASFLNVWAIDDIILNNLTRLFITSKQDNTGFLGYITFWLQSSGQSWGMEMQDSDGFTTMHCVLGLHEPTQKMEVSFSDVRVGSTAIPLPVLHGVELAEAEEQGRKNGSLGLAPSLAEQVKILADSESGGNAWWWEEGWTK